MCSRCSRVLRSSLIEWPLKLTTKEVKNTKNLRPGSLRAASAILKQRYSLDFGPTFYFDCNVLVDDQVTSMTGVDPAAGQSAAVAFATTHWSLVLAAQGESAAAHQALEKLCRTYRRPLYAFVRRQGYSHEEAEDLTQGFFAVLLERRDFDR